MKEEKNQVKTDLREPIKMARGNFADDIRVAKQLPMYEKFRTKKVAAAVFSFMQTRGGTLLLPFYEATYWRTINNK